VRHYITITVEIESAEDVEDAARDIWGTASLWGHVTGITGANEGIDDLV
jgi:hypothetical protein